MISPEKISYRISRIEQRLSHDVVLRTIENDILKIRWIMSNHSLEQCRQEAEVNLVVLIEELNRIRNKDLPLTLPIS